MTIPLRQLPIHAFLGSQEDSHSLTLVQVHSSGGSKNVWIDKLGCVRSIQGFTKQNLTAVASATYSTNLRLVGLYAYNIYQAAEGVLRTAQQLLGVFSGVDSVTGSLVVEIHVSQDAGASWLRLNGFTDPTSEIPIFAQIGELAIITGLTRVPTRWDGTTHYAITANFQGSTPAITRPGAGGLTGNVKFRIVPVWTNGTKQNGSAPTVVEAFAHEAALLTWTASTDPQVASYNVYRTTGTGEIYFLEGQTTGLTFTCTKDDLDLIQGEVLLDHGDEPPNCAFCMLHKGRMWYGNIFTAVAPPQPLYPRRWYFSDPGKPDSVLQERHFVDCTDGESSGDRTTGGTGDYNDMAVLWLERSIWTVKGTMIYQGPVIDMDLKKSDAKQGTVSVRTVVRIPSGSVFTNEVNELQKTQGNLLAYLTANNDIRFFDGKNDRVFSFPMAETLKTMNFGARHRAFAIEDQSRSEVIWCIPTGNSEYPDKAVVWNTKWGVWYMREWDFACAVSYASRNAATVILAGEGDIAVGGFCYKLWNSRRFDGVQFVSQWMSKTLYGLARSGEMEQGGEIFSYDKRFRWADVHWWASRPMQLEVAWLECDAGDDDTPVGTTRLSLGSENLYTSSGAPILTAGGQNIQVAAVRAGGMINRAPLQDSNGEFHHGRGVRLRIRAVQS